MAKAAEAFRTISEVADDLGIHKHVLRFWEVKFSQIRPMKRGGGRRYYRPEDMELLRGIQRLLHRDGYTIKGVQKILREQGVEAVKDIARDDADAPGAKSIAPAAGSESAAASAPSIRGKARVGAAKPLAGEARAVLTNIVAELMRCRALLAGQSDTLDEGSRRSDRRSRRAV